MFYCEDCRLENNWPPSLMKSNGTCEVCGKNAVCYDLHHKYLPVPKKPTLYLIRGVSGSGKTTYACSLELKHHYEADMYMEKNNGYNPFKPELLKEAHQWCLSMTRNALLSKQDVVVSNTFIRLWEMQPYKDLAKELGIKLSVITMIGSYDNTHGVPEEKVRQMRASFEYEPYVWDPQ